MSASNFPRCLAETLSHEGGFVDHPKDPGGATNMGITFATLRKWRKRAITKADVKALTVEDVRPIYKAWYWAPVKGDDLPAGLDLALFDFAVNSGETRAIIALQRILGVADDGKLGPATMSAVYSRDTRDLVLSLCAERLRFLKGLKTWATFGKGWTRRVESVLRVAVDMIGEVPAPQPITTPQEEPVMDEVKGMLQSRAVWSSVIALLALFSPKLYAATQSFGGVDAIVGSVNELVAAGATVSAIYFRVKASAKIGKA
jgi:lysozyme family protein